MNGFNGFSLKEKLSNIWYGYRKYIIIISIVVLVMLITLIIVLNSSKNNKQKHAYELVESIMVYNAKEYIKNNEITKDMYISLNYLNIEIDSNLKCNSNSGVLVEDNSYTPYLMCEGYNSQVVANVIKENEENSKYGVLLGDNPYIVTDTYQELGISLVEGYTVNIKDSNIDNGINKVTYNILESGSYVTHIDRIVIAEGILGSAPVIELVGNQTRTLEINTQYIESGYTATDKIDGNITDKVKVDGNVDVTKAGTYTLTYSVTNTRGKSASVKRKVIVNDNSINLEITHKLSEIVNSSIKITLDIKGEGYSYTITDNGEKVTSKNPTYTAYKNGTYEFTVYDNNNNSEVYSVNIANLDNTPPVLTCTGKIEDGKTTITMTANEDINYYILKSPNKAEIKVTENKYTYNDSFTNVDLTGYDTSNNASTISCDIEYKNVSGTLRDCKNRIVYDNLPVRLMWCCDSKAAEGTKCSCSYTGYNDRFPGGIITKNGVKVSKDTVTWKEYLQGNIEAEIGVYMNTAGLEAVKLHILLSSNAVWSHLNNSGRVKIVNNELWIAISHCCFQSFDLKDYNALSNSNKQIFEEAYNEVKDLILYDVNKKEITYATYRSKMQDEMYNQSKQGYSYYEILKSTYFKEYTLVGYDSYFYEETEVYRCE